MNIKKITLSENSKVFIKIVSKEFKITPDEIIEVALKILWNHLFSENVKCSVVNDKTLTLH